MSNTEKAENIIKGLLSFCEPSEVIFAIANELNHNSEYFGEHYNKQDMSRMINSLGQSADISHVLLHE